MIHSRTQVYFSWKGNHLSLLHGWVQAAGTLSGISKRPSVPWVNSVPRPRPSCLTPAVTEDKWCCFQLMCIETRAACFKFYFLILFFYFTILCWFYHTSTWICHGYTCVPHLEPPSHLPPRTIPLGHPSAPAPSILYPTSNLDWRFISYTILYMFQCDSPKSSHPLPLPQSPKVHSTHLCLFCCLAYRVIITIFLNSIYCIGVFLSGLLQSV